MGNANGANLNETEVPKIEELFKVDGYLKPYESEIRRRYGCFKYYLENIENNLGGLDKFTQSYKSFGVHVDAKNNVTVLEWAPGARNVFLRGDFSRLILFIYFSSKYNLFNLVYLSFKDEWKLNENKFEKLEYGKWKLSLPALADGSCPIKHGSSLKVAWFYDFFI
jgi:1,4-alpha-glucan branching enzyme